jgi:5'(3')-deoxyribonucleotidase
MKIWIDMDGVLCNTAHYLCTLRGGLKAEIDRYEYIYPDGTHIGHAMNEMLETHALRIPQIDGALAGVHMLYQQGHNIGIVTSRPEHLLNLSRKWLSTKMITHHVFASAHRGTLVGDILIDDKMQNCHDFAGISLLFSQPWNIKDEITSDRVIRIWGWNDIVLYLGGK